MKKFLMWLIPLLAGAALTASLINPGLGMVPDLKGLPLDAAMAKVIDRGFDPSVTYDEGGKANEVLGQAPAPRTLHRRGSKVILFVSKGVVINVPSSPPASVPDQQIEERNIGESGNGSGHPNFRGHWKLSVSRSGISSTSNLTFTPDGEYGYLSIMGTSDNIIEKAIIGSDPSGEQITMALRTDGTETHFTAPGMRGKSSDDIITTRWEGSTLITVEKGSWKNIFGNQFNYIQTSYWTLSADNNVLTIVEDNRSPGLLYGEDKAVTTLVYERQL